MTHNNFWLQTLYSYDDIFSYMFGHRYLDGY